MRTGSDTTLVAPVTLGDGAFTAAGSVITRDVPPGALGVARGEQENVEGYAERRAARRLRDQRRGATPPEPSGPGAVTPLVQSRFGRRQTTEGDEVADSSCCVITTQKRLIAVRRAQQPRSRREDRREAGHHSWAACSSRPSPTARSTRATRRTCAAPTCSSSQSPCGKGHINDEVMELLIMIQAAKLASARRVTAVVPYFPYSRQDKKSASREPITARLMATLLEAAGADRVLSMDLHQGQIQGFFTIPVDHMTAVPMLADYFRYKDFGGRPVVGVSADAGGVKLAKRFINRLPGAELAVLTKMRPEHNRAETMHFIGDVRDKIAIVVDDMIDTGGLRGERRRHAVRERRPRGVRDRHPRHILSAGVRASARVARQGGRGHRHRAGRTRASDGKIKVLSVADTLASTIKNVFEDESVSELFAGENQLFCRRRPMEKVSLVVQPRDTTGSRAARRLRGAGLIPGVLYGHGKAATLIAVDPHALRDALTGGRHARRARRHLRGSQARPQGHRQGHAARPHEAPS